jgi:membrane peptidoglycan carboxypeptidase
VSGSTRRSSARPSRGSGRGSASPTKAPAKRRLIDYPRSGYHGVRRWLPSWRFLAGSVLAVMFLGLGVVVGAYVLLDVPAASAEVKYQTSTVYFADKADGTRGSVMGTFNQQKRQIVDYDTLPAYVGEAFVASEDRTFFENSGIDVKGITRALWNNLQGKPTQGGSTLTQQYVERYYKGRTTTDLAGKAEEALLAIKIGRTESKDEILGRYLNTIYMGRDSYGIQAAAQSYFGVDAANLTVEQAAVIAGLVPSPNNWDPAVSPDKAEQRWNRVLDLMVEDGYVTAADRAAMVFPTTIVYQRSNTFAGTNGYLLQMVLDELQADMKISVDDIQTGGYTIVTTIDESVQAEAVRAAGDLTSGALAGEAPNARTRLGIATIDATDGAIVALYGGPDYLTDARNTVTYEKIQAASTFKPFTLVAALEKGIGLDTVLSGNSPMTVEGWDSQVKNFGSGRGQSFGDIDLVKATANSVNTVYAQLNQMVTPEASAEVAARAGVTLPQPNVPSNVLGTGDVHVLDMASAYATFAAQGVHSDPFVVRQVLNSDDTVAWTGGSTPQRVFAADVMADTTYAMQQVVQQGTGKEWIKPLGVPLAGKTGSSSDNKSAWFIGFTPRLVTAVALFQNGEDGSSLETISPFGGVAQVTGGTWPAALWADYMKPVLAMPTWAATTSFPERANVGSTPTVAPTVAPTVEPTAEPTEEATVVDMPSDLVGKTEADASAVLLGLGLDPVIVTESSPDVPAGRVIRAEPGGGASVAVGSAVTLVVSSGPPAATPEPTPVPTAG